MGDIVETHLQFYSEATLSLVSDTILPPVLSNGTTVEGDGRYVFWNSSETKLVGIVEAEASAGLATPDSVFLASFPSPGSNCPSSLSANAASLAAAGGKLNVTLTVGAGCDWTASSSASWVTITSTVSGSGSGTVGLTVQPNSSEAPRMASVSIAGQSLTITEAAASSCTYVTNPASAVVDNNGGTGSFEVLGPASCRWTAVSSAPWVTITGNSSGDGDGIISYTVPYYLGPSRLTTISIAGQLFTITQTGVDAPYNALQFVPVTPCRVLDTRNTNGPFGGPYVSANTSRDFAIPSSACNIPATAGAYALNITVVPKTELNYLTVWATGQPQPNVSVLNSYDGRIKAASAIIAAGVQNNGAVSFFATNDTDLIVDISGYFTAENNPGSAALMFYPLAPCRIADTRQSGGSLGGRTLAAGESRAFAVQSTECGVPATAQAYALNLTAVPQGPLAYMTAWPAGQAQPLVSVLNAPTGTVTANAAIVPAGTNGDVSIFTTNKTDLVLDIQGYFARWDGTGYSYFPAIPCRILDTRMPAGSPAVSGTIEVNLNAGVCNVDVNASAFALNATVVPPGPLPYLTLWSAAQPQPLASNLNALDGAVTSNLSIVPAENVSIQAFTPAPTYLILDLFGYFSNL